MPYHVFIFKKIFIFRRIIFQFVYDVKLAGVLIKFNKRHLSRIYPVGTRVSSSNFLPTPMWNTGCHMVALNYQTPDKAMQLNQGKFLANGRCGYVLKPRYMLNDNFTIENPETFTDNFPINLTIEIISGRYLSRYDKMKDICCFPLVNVEVLGLPFDCKIYRTKFAYENGFNPVWRERFTFSITTPEIALLKFYVEDGNLSGAKSDPFIGQAVYPVDCLRGGYRSVPLLNPSSESLEHSALLVHVEIQPIKHPGIKLLQPHQYLQAGRTMQKQDGYWQRIRIDQDVSIFKDLQNLQPPFQFSESISTLSPRCSTSGNSSSSVTKDDPKPSKVKSGSWFKIMKRMGKKKSSNG